MSSDGYGLQKIMFLQGVGAVQGDGSHALSREIVLLRNIEGPGNLPDQLPLGRRGA
jgi:hypothetical protein